METSVHTEWRQVDQPYETIKQPIQTGPTRTINVPADTKAEALEKAKSICYEACDSRWTQTGVKQKDGKTYRVYKRYVLENYYVQ